MEAEANVHRERCAPQHWLQSLELAGCLEQWFLDENRLSRLQYLDTKTSMKVVRHRDGDGIHVG